MKYKVIVIIGLFLVIGCSDDVKSNKDLIYQNNSGQVIIPIEDLANYSNPGFIKASSLRQKRMEKELNERIKQSGVEKLTAELGPPLWEEAYFEGDNDLHKVTVPTVKNNTISSILYFYGNDEDYNIFVYKKERLKSIIEDISKQHA